MARRLILCSGCGSKNRIAPSKSGQPKCGNCGKFLSVPSHPNVGFDLFKRPVTWFVVVGLVFGGYAWLQNDRERRVGTNVPDFSNFGRPIQPTTPAGSRQPTSPVGIDTGDSEPVDAGHELQPVVAFSGVLQRPAEPSVAPFSIRTRPGNSYYVKLVDMADRTVMTMFVVGGIEFETEVPLGTYEMRYAAGKTWYGTEHFFGPETVFSRTDRRFNFRLDGNRYSGFTVELILHENGNLRTSRLSRANF